MRIRLRLNNKSNPDLQAIGTSCDGHGSEPKVSDPNPNSFSFIGSLFFCNKKKSIRINIWTSQDPDSKIYKKLNSDPIKDRIRIYTKKVWNPNLNSKISFMGSESNISNPDPQQLQRKTRIRKFNIRSDPDFHQTTFAGSEPRTVWIRTPHTLGYFLNSSHENPSLPNHIYMRGGGVGYSISLPIG
jgi:hypothetical protein